MILALAGGVGGAKLAQGLAVQIPPGKLRIVVNTGDDFVHLGMHISPDLDTVMYWLAGINDAERGWGVAGDTWNYMSALRQAGGADWFQIGDRDLLTHQQRTHCLQQGDTLSQATHFLCGQLSVNHAIVPMSDQPVATIVHTRDGALAFQDYFVRQRCEPVVIAIKFDGVERAVPSPAFAEAMTARDLQAVVICPSNPLLSIEPVLALPNVREWLLHRRVPVIAVSPIVGGRAIKGPAAKIFRELGLEASVTGIARHYRGLIDCLVIDNIDIDAVPAIESQGIHAAVTNTVMKDADDRAALAKQVLDLAARLKERTHA